MKVLQPRHTCCQSDRAVDCLPDFTFPPSGSFEKSLGFAVISSTGEKKASSAVDQRKLAHKMLPLRTVNFRAGSAAQAWESFAWESLEVVGRLFAGVMSGRHLLLIK